MRVRVVTALTTLLAFLITVFVPAGARAQTPPPSGAATPPPPPPPPPAGAPPAAPGEDAAMAQAKQHFETGKNAYNAGDYVGAIREFKAAEALRPSPILDYNIGLANEKLNKKRVAVKYYHRYLEMQPNARNRPEVEQRIAALEAEIAKEPPPAATATPGGTAPQPGSEASEMPPPMTNPPPPPSAQPQYDPYASAPPPGYNPYAAQPVKKKKSRWWIGLIIAGAATLTVVAIVLAVYFATPSTVYTPVERLPAPRVDRKDLPLTLFHF